MCTLENIPAWKGVWVPQMFWELCLCCGLLSNGVRRWFETCHSHSGSGNGTWKMEAGSLPGLGLIH